MEISNNKKVVLALYEALTTLDVTTVHKLLAPVLEWWFHGPPSHQFLVRLLSGTAGSPQDRFIFSPKSIAVFGSTVIVEGYDIGRSISWVHAWTVTDGIITQVREYFNTSLIVINCLKKKEESGLGVSSLSSCPSVWESSVAGLNGKSVPGVILVI